MSLFYISFASKGAGFLGAAVVNAAEPTSALLTAAALGINPGGEAIIAELPNLPTPTGPVPERFIGRLLSKAELEVCFGELVKGSGGPEGSVSVCEACNEGRQHVH